MKPQPTKLPNDPRWNAVETRDASVDGTFWYSVRTTGVYCRPSCGSRTPLRQNVAFHATREDAERAGFRPCKRCKPDGPSQAERQATLVAAACRTIEAAESMPTLEVLAQQAGLSPFHFQRMFKAVAGVTPRQYGAAHRGQRMRRELGSATRVTDAIYEAGYGSSSRFYETAADELGMTASRFRRGGEEAHIRFAVGQCSLGAILVARSDQGICAITLGDDPDALVRQLQDRFPNAELVGDDRDFDRVVAQVVGFVEAPNRGLDLPLDIRGTAFQRRVWQALREIPAGETVSYTEVAHRIGAPASVRAVAGACAANHLAVAVPCHRVVRNDGGLSGYRWGVERKRALLEREGRQ